MNIIKETIKTLIDAGKEVGLEENTESKVCIDISSPECRTES
jgi:hypothetical protein